jgi:hypothetical protein
MAGNIRINEVDDTIPTIVAAKVLEYIQANTVLVQLVRRDFDNEVAQAGNVVKIGTPGTMVANDKTAGSAITLNQAADSAISVTLNKHKESSFLLEDPAKMFAKPDWFDIYLRQSIAVIAEQMDADLAALYSGFSQTIDATGANGPLDGDDFREARRLLSRAKAPATDRHAVLHPDAEYYASSIENIINSAYAATLGGAAREAYITNAFGFKVFTDQQITVASSVDENMFFHRDAMILVTRPMAQAPDGMGVKQSVMSENGIGLRVTVSYSHLYLGLICTVDILYGVAEGRDNHGVVVQTTAIS